MGVSKMSGVVAAVTAVRLERRWPVRDPRRRKSGECFEGKRGVTYDV